MSDFLAFVVQHAEIDALRARLAEALRLLADLARTRTTRPGSVETAATVDAWRRRISQKIEDVQTLIESCKFEPGTLDLDALQRRTGGAQVVFVLLLALARHAPTSDLPRVAQARAFELDVAVATTLEALATRAVGEGQAVVPNLTSALDALERAMYGSPDAPGHAISTPRFAGALALYRSLVASVARLSPGPLTTAMAA